MSGGEIIELESPIGRQLESEARDGKDGSIIHDTMLEVFAKQIGRSCCGIQSCSMVLNSIHCNNAGQCQSEIVLKDLPYIEEKIFDYEETLTVTSLERVETGGRGCNLDEVGRILSSHGLKVQKYDVSLLNCDEFRKLASSALNSLTTEVIVNYFMNHLDPKFPLVGHHSPLAGYHVGTDRFLVMDVWKDTPECWVKAEILYKAMNTADDETGDTRGFVIAGPGAKTLGS